MRDARLRSVARVFPSNVDKKALEGQEPVQLCNYTDVYYNEFIHSGLKFKSATAAPHQIRSFSLDEGDVLITKDSETPDDIAVPALVIDEMFGVLCGYHLALIRPNRKRVDPRFLFRALTSGYVNRQFAVAATGITRYGLRTDAIRDARIPLPGLRGQTLIADFLDRETKRIDALVEAKRKLIGLLAEKRTALITHAATKGLDPSAPMKDSGIPLIGQIPAHWGRTELKRVCRIRYGLGQPPPEAEEGVAVIRATNIDRGCISSVDMMFARLADLPLDRAPLLQAGEILVVRSGALTGDSAIVTPEFAGSAPGYDLRLTPTRANSEYLGWCMLSDLVAQQIGVVKKRAAQPHLNAEELGAVVIPEPPPEEQAAIGRFLDSKTSRVEGANRNLRTQLSLLSEYRQALITTAVTGQLDEETLKGRKPADEALGMEVPS